MRLYLNKKEVPLLKRALTSYIKRTTSPENAERMQAVLERVELCEKLQDNEKKSAKEELNILYGNGLFDTDSVEVITDESY